MVTKLIKVSGVLLLGGLLSSCASFHQTSPIKHSYAEGTYLGASSGFATGLAATSTMPIPLGVALGSAFGLSTGSFYGSREGLARQLRQNGAQVVVIGDTTSVYVPSDKLFKANTSTIDPKAYPMLSNIVRLARLYKKSQISITGHADSVATAQDSQKISRSQADSVAGYLWAEGVPHEELAVTGAGNIKPIANNVSATGSASNRHVLLTFVRPQFA